MSRRGDQTVLEVEVLTRLPSGGGGTGGEVFRKIRKMNTLDEMLHQLLEVMIWHLSALYMENLDVSTVLSWCNWAHLQRWYTTSRIKT